MTLYRYCLPLLALAVAVGLMGCDSGVAPTSSSAGDANTTVQFAASGAAVTEADGTTTIELTIRNPDGNSVNVDVIFAAPASDATADDFAVQGAELTPIEGSDALFVTTVSFPAGSEDGDGQVITITDLSDEDATEARESAIFALQNVQTSGSARIGSPSSFDLSIGFPTIREARDTPLGNNITVQGTVNRIDGSVTFLQDESGGIATFDDAFAEGVSIGDRVVVGGEMDVFAGLLQITDIGEEGFTVLSSDNEVEAETATLAELAENGESFESTLVRVEGMSFDDSGTFQASTNYTLSDGSGGAVQLRITSNSFYIGQPIPGGEVTFEGVLSQFNGNFGGIEPNTGYQLLALNEGDLTGGDDNGGGPQPVSINTARQSLDQQVIIEGTVTRAFGAYARVQDNSGPTGASALVIRQTSGGNSDAFQGDIESGAIQPGTTLQLTGTVTEFNGVVQINGGDLASYQVVSQGSAPSPQSITLADLESGGEDYESELVEVSDLTFTEASGSFENGTSYDVSDGTTTLTLRVQNDNESALAGESIPSEAFTYTGVTGEFNGSYQLIPVRPSDIGTSGGGETSTINEARQDIGATVTIEGTVSRAFGDFTRIQDASGPTGASALVIRQTGGAFFDDVAAGDITAGTTLRITGTTSEFNGVAQINNDDLASYEVVSQGEAPAPQSITLADLDSNGEDYESELVEISDLTFTEATGSFENGTSYDVSDGTATLTFRVQGGSESDLGGVAIPENAFTYTGVTGEFNGSYQLIPIFPSDIGAADDGGGTPDPITLEEARALEDDEPVVFEAILTRGKGRYLFFQDETAGLQLFDFGGFNDQLDAGELAIGDRVRVSGVMGTFSEQRQVTDAELEVLSSGNELPAVQTITLEELNTNGEAYIHELVRVENFTIDAGGDDVFQAGGGDGNYDIDDGTATGVLRLEGSSSSEYEGEPIPSGEVSFEGAVTQFQGTYQLHLALESDLITE